MEGRKSEPDRFPVAIVTLLDGRKLYAKDYSTLNKALNRIGSNRKEEVELKEMSAEEYQAIPATIWADELTKP